MRYPASNPNTISVGATDQDDKRASFSNYGSDLFISAPGEDIYSTSKGSNYGNKDGTSFSSPQVSAVIALLKQIKPSISNTEVKEVLKLSADKVGGYTYVNGRSDELGFGRLNAFKAIKRVLWEISGPSLICNSNNGSYSVAGIPTGGTVYWEFNPNLLIEVSGQNTTNYVVKAKSTSYGSSWVKANIIVCNDTTEIQKDIWIGKPDIPTTNPTGYPTVQLNSGQMLNVTLSDSPGAAPTSGFWESSGSIYNFSSTGAMCMFEAIGSGNGNFYVTISNVCGTSLQGGGSVYVSGGGGGGPLGPMLSTYPNPATESFEVVLDESISEDSIIDVESELKIFDKNNVLIEIKRFKGKKVKLKTFKYSQGLHLVQITNKFGRFTTKVIINK